MKNKSQTSVILWFKDNLRLSDNCSLVNAVTTSKPIIPIFINTDEHNDKAKKWLKLSLNSLASDIKQNQGQLFYFEDQNIFECLIKLCNQLNIKEIFADAHSSFNQHQKEIILQDKLKKAGIILHLSPPNLLLDRGLIKNKSDKPYQKFAGFYNRICDLDIPYPLEKPQNLNFYLPENLQQHILNWHQAKNNLYTKAGEQEAIRTLNEFMNNRMSSYAKIRDFPSLKGTSLLSANLVFGEISARTVWHTVNNYSSETGKHNFLRQLVWRDFCHDLLMRYPLMSEQNIHEEFDNFTWDFDEKLFNKWSQGITGYPLVDAGMRELNQTGYMHNRVRMVTASFLTKHLLIPWQYGEKYFKSKLIDYDEANNAGNWQWVAGCGMDSAPFFRIFNPTIQAKKFDQKNEYIQKYIPELHTTSYPKPIVNHERARETALKAYHTMKGHI